MNGGIVGLALPIPSDPANVGRVLLFQWATLTPDTQILVLSDVYGSEIMASTESAASPPQAVANMTTGEIFKTFSVTLDTPKHDLLRAKIRASADRLTKAKR